MNIFYFVGVWALLLWQVACSSGACNVTLYAEREPLNFTSPNYPNNYNNNEFCFWDIYPQTSGYSVVLDMVYSNIDGSPPTCHYDALSIYVINNADHTSADVKRICGSSRWNIVVENDQHFHIVFGTDAWGTKSGFLIRFYESKERAICGVPLVATSVGKTFTSPGYPNAYFQLQSCTWTITTEHPNTSVVLYTIDSEIQDGRTPMVCDRDYVTVYNGHNSSDTLGTFCGDQKPVFASGGNSLRIYLHTDSTEIYKGFKMVYQAVPATSCSATVPAGKSPIQIVSPGYPNNYPSGLDCQWTIHAPAGNRIRIEVIFADMEIAPFCANDYLLFDDGSSTVDGQIKICNVTSSPIVSSSNLMSITFHSDSSVTGKGFRLKYSAADNSCSSRLAASQYTEKYLTSPGYPSSKANNMHCTWTLSAMVGYIIKVKIVNLSLGTSCSSDYLLFSDGSSPYATQLGRYCGNNPRDGTVVSSGNHMNIVFHTNSSGRGFKLKYTAETASARNCTSSWLSASTHTWKRLASPGYPNNYANNLHCRWTITAPVGRKVIVEIAESSIEYAVSCADDYLLVSEGSSSYATQLGKYCGFNTGSVFSSSNYVTITFHTDSSVNRKGFTLRYKSTTSGCGQDVQLSGSETKYVESPNYPFDYPANTDCAWTVSTDVEGSSINVKVVTFDLPYDMACYSGDYVILQEVDGANEYWLGQWCGSSGPDTQSVGSTLKIRFHADGSRSSSGFKLAVTAVYPESDPAYKVNTSAVIGGVIASIVVVAVLACCCCGVCSRKKPTTNGPQRDRSGGSSVYSVPLSNHQGTAAVFIPPPAYSEVVKDDPPPYCEIAQLSDVQPIVASSPCGATGIDNPAPEE
ncbi:cubilin-like [Haliotis asinina]|uniref:cubilin-like n=1 Tax=Haliotis asinina TaxID=109174 RepID=UPI003531BECF